MVSLNPKHDLVNELKKKNNMVVNRILVMFVQRYSCICVIATNLRVLTIILCLFSYDPHITSPPLPVRVFFLNI